MRLVAYCRVSTEDKGQNPRRQEDVLEAWAARNGHTVLASFKDEGTSGGVSPLDRNQVQLAIKKAKELDADGLLVESVDRWTRVGVHDFFESSIALEVRHHLHLVIADVPQGTDGMMYELFVSLHAIIAKETRRRIREQVSSGLARAKREGWKNGRPGKKPKPNLSPDEAAYVREQKGRGRQGAGWGKMAAEITRRRGALEVVDRKAQDRRVVSPSWLRMEWRRIEAGSITRSWRTPAPAKYAGDGFAGAGGEMAGQPAKEQEVAAGGKA